MQLIDTLLLARWIVPIEPANTILEHHALAIDGDKIIALMPIVQAQAAFQAKTTLQLEDHVLMPGLVNAHTHSPMALLRGIADDLALTDWLVDYIWPAERQVMSEAFAYDGTQLAILEMLRSGTTCFNDMYFYPQAIAQAAADAKMRAMIGACVINFSSPYAKDNAEYLAKVVALAQAWQSHPLISTAIAPHAPYTVDDATFLQIKKLADKHQLLIHLHLHETSHEITQSLQEYGKRPLKRIFDLGIMSKQLQCVHMTQIDQEDLNYLQSTGAHIIHSPQSNLKLASGFCPVKKLIDHNINVALGTDSAASNNNLDMFEEMRTASLLAKAVSTDPTALDAFATLQMATLNGARALGLEHKIGSLLPGKAADIIAIDLSNVTSQPIYNVISLLAYSVNSQQVSDVWVAGKPLLVAGKFKTLNEKSILQKAQYWQQKLQK